MATEKYDILDRPERKAREKAEKEAAAQAREDKKLQTLRDSFMEKTKKFAKLPTQSDGREMETVNSMLFVLGNKIDKAYMQQPDQPIDTKSEEMLLAYMTLKALAYMMLKALALNDKVCMILL